MENKLENSENTVFFKTKNPEKSKKIEFKIKLYKRKTIQNIQRKSKTQKIQKNNIKPRKFRKLDYPENLENSEKPENSENPENSEK